METTPDDDQEGEKLAMGCEEEMNGANERQDVEEEEVHGKCGRRPQPVCWSFRPPLMTTQRTRGQTWFPSLGIVGCIDQHHVSATRHAT